MTAAPCVTTCCGYDEEEAEDAVALWPTEKLPERGLCAVAAAAAHPAMRPRHRCFSR